MEIIKRLSLICILLAISFTNRGFVVCSVRESVHHYAPMCTRYNTNQQIWQKQRKTTSRAENIKSSRYVWTPTRHRIDPILNRCFFVCHVLGVTWSPYHFHVTSSFFDANIKYMYLSYLVTNYICMYILSACFRDHRQRDKSKRLSLGWYENSTKGRGKN